MLKPWLQSAAPPQRRLQGQRSERRLIEEQQILTLSTLLDDLDDMSEEERIINVL